MTESLLRPTSWQSEWWNDIISPLLLHSQTVTINPVRITQYLLTMWACLFVPSWNLSVMQTLVRCLGKYLAWWSGNGLIFLALRRWTESSINFRMSSWNRFPWPLSVSFQVQLWDRFCIGHICGHMARAGWWFYNHPGFPWLLSSLWYHWQWYSFGPTTGVRIGQHSSALVSFFLQGACPTAHK